MSTEYLGSILFIILKFMVFDFRVHTSQCKKLKSNTFRTMCLASKADSCFHHMLVSELGTPCQCHGSGKHEKEVFKDNTCCIDISVDM